MKGLDLRLLHASWKWDKHKSPLLPFTCMVSETPLSPFIIFFFLNDSCKLEMKLLCFTLFVLDAVASFSFFLSSIRSRSLLFSIPWPMQMQERPSSSCVCGPVSFPNLILTTNQNNPNPLNQPHPCPPVLPRHLLLSGKTIHSRHNPSSLISVLGSYSCYIIDWNFNWLVTQNDQFRETGNVILNCNLFDESIQGMKWERQKLRASE